METGEGLLLFWLFGGDMHTMERVLFLASVNEAQNSGFGLHYPKLKTRPFFGLVVKHPKTVMFCSLGFS